MFVERKNHHGKNFNYPRDDFVFPRDCFYGLGWLAAKIRENVEYIAHKMPANAVCVYGRALKGEFVRS